MVKVEVGDIMKPHMEQAELDLFSKHVSESIHYFEFGMGGSTVHVYETSSATIESIDSSKEWVNKIQQKINDSDRLSTRYINIGPVGGWGRPRDQSMKHDWPLYSSSIHNSNIIPDVVLVDGRFRVACIANTISHAIQNNSMPKIILHDSKRKYYDAGKNMLKLIDSAQSLNVYEIDCDDIQHVQSVIEKFKFDSR